MGIQDKMISTRTAAQRLELHPRTLNNWRSQKKTDLPWYVIGSRTIRYRASEVEKFAAERGAMITRDKKTT